MKLQLGFCLVICFVGVHCIDISTLIKDEESLSQYIAECVAETKVGMNTVTDADKNKEIPNTPEMQCYLACMMKKEGMMNGDGTLTKEFLENDRTKDCRNLGGKDACEVAYKTIQCLVKAVPNKESH